MGNLAERRAQMVERQLVARGIGGPVLRAMGEVPRERFVPERLAASAYDDGPLPIGHGQTISQPYIVGLMIEAAAVAPGDRVLEVGAGSGYAAAVLSRIASEVFGIERHEALARAAQARLGALGYTNVTVIAGDGSAGLADKAPFHAILVSAAGERVPGPLKRQLRIGGRLVLPIGGGEGVQALLCVTRTGEDAWTEVDLGGVRFVPLVGAFGHGGGTPGGGGPA